MRDTSRVPQEIAEGFNGKRGLAKMLKETPFTPGQPTIHTNKTERGKARPIMPESELPTAKENTASEIQQRIDKETDNLTKCIPNIPEYGNLADDLLRVLIVPLERKNKLTIKEKKGLFILKTLLQLNKELIKSQELEIAIEKPEEEVQEPEFLPAEDYDLIEGEEPQTPTYQPATPEAEYYPPISSAEAYRNSIKGRNFDFLEKEEDRLVEEIRTVTAKNKDADDLKKMLEIVQEKIEVEEGEKERRRKWAKEVATNAKTRKKKTHEEIESNERETRGFGGAARTTSQDRQPQRGIGRIHETKANAIIKIAGQDETADEKVTKKEVEPQNEKYRAIEISLHQLNNLRESLYGNRIYVKTKMHGLTRFFGLGKKEVILKFDKLPQNGFDAKNPLKGYGLLETTAREADAVDISDLVKYRLVDGQPDIQKKLENMAKMVERLNDQVSDVMVTDPKIAESQLFTIYARKAMHRSASSGLSR